MPLTDTRIRTAKPGNKPTKLSDSHGLYLLVSPTGGKFWRYRYRIGGKENVFALGEYPEIGLAEARAKRLEARALVKKGVHPARQRRAERLAAHVESSNTFEAVGREWMAQNVGRWSPSYGRQVTDFLSANVFPALGGLPIREVKAAALLDVLRKVEGRGAATVASLLRQWSSAIFRYGIATLRCEADPAAALKGAIRTNATEHSPPLSREEIAAFTRALNAYGGNPETEIALKLMLYTFVRTSEMRAARWSEFDFDRPEWRIPAQRMKMKQTHIVPLARQSLELLAKLQTFTGGQTFLFPNSNQPNAPMARMTLNRALERMGFDFTAHSFRSTASTILNEMGFRPDVIERQLAHAERNKVRAAYNQAQLMPERRQMMQQWADIVDDIATGGRVVALYRGVR